MNTRITGTRDNGMRHVAIESRRLELGDCRRAALAQPLAALELALRLRKLRLRAIHVGLQQGHSLQHREHVSAAHDVTFFDPQLLDHHHRSRRP